MAKIWGRTRHHRAVDAQERAETAQWLKDVIAEVEAVDPTVEVGTDRHFSSGERALGVA